MRSGANSSLTQCVSLVLVLFLFALGWTLFLRQPEAAEMQQESGRLREESGRLRERLRKCEARALDLGAEIRRRSGTRELEESRVRDWKMSLQKQITAQEKSIKELQDQNGVLTSELTGLQGSLQRCEEAKEHQGNECMRINENLRENQQQIHNLRRRTSNLEFALDRCRSNSCKEQEGDVLWYILPFVLGLCLGCCSGCFARS